mmetsp:Transcript_5000/g.9066  ORF Transcript_5000/g.9066 Transcript_5000/m.9066 type:complete len:205 (-) Transcript_5000:436-1050(-)
MSMRQQILTRGTLPRILLQTQPDHGAERLGPHIDVVPVVVRFQAGRILLYREQQHLHGGELGVRRVALAELQRGDAEAPYVRLVIVAVHLLHDLGGHPARRADEGGGVLPAVAAVDEPGGHAEVGDAHVRIAVEEEVARLDVPVDLAVVVDVLESQECFVEGVGYVRLEEEGFGGDDGGVGCESALQYRIVRGVDCWVVGGGGG